MLTLLVTSANSTNPETGSLAPYIVVMGLLALLVLASVVWVVRGRTWSSDRAQDHARDHSQRRSQ